MSTRGLAGFYIDGAYRGSYNHFDSYPACLGRQMAAFVAKSLWNTELRDHFAARVRALKWVDARALVKDAALVRRYRRFCNRGVGKHTEQEWYCLLRETQGADMLAPIQSGELGHVIDSMDFARDSLFCEWAYFLNLDQSTFEVFCGFQKSAHNASPFLSRSGRRRAHSEYYPIKRIAVFSMCDATLIERVASLENGHEDCTMRKAITQLGHMA